MRGWPVIKNELRTKNTKVTIDHKFVSFCLHSVSNQRQNGDRMGTNDFFDSLDHSLIPMSKTCRMISVAYGQMCHCPRQWPLSTCLQCDDMCAMCLSASAYYDKASCKLCRGVTGRFAGTFFCILLVPNPMHEDWGLRETMENDTYYWCQCMASGSYPVASDKLSLCCCTETTHIKHQT